LADARRNCRGSIRFCDQICTLWSFIRQESLGESGDEDDGRIKRTQEVIDSIHTRAPIRQLNVGKDQFWLVEVCNCDGLPPVACDSNYAMAHFFDLTRQIYRNEHFVLDDQNIRGYPSGDFSTEIVDPPVQRSFVDIERIRGIFFRKLLDKHQ
jgi:hypothetical protein